MRHRFAASLVLGAVLAAPGIADNATDNLDALKAEIQREIDTTFGVLDPTNDPKTIKCQNAFLSAAAILSTDTATTKADLQALKRTVRKLKKWFAVFPDTAAIADAAADAFTEDLTAEGATVLQLVAEIESERDARRIQRLTSRADKKLQAAFTASNAVRRVKNLVAAAKLLQKARDKAERFLPVNPGGDGPRLIIVSTGKNAEGIEQVMYVELPAIRGLQPTTRQVSTGASSVKDVQPLYEYGNGGAGGAGVMYSQGTSLFLAGAKDAPAEVVAPGGSLRLDEGLYRLKYSPASQSFVAVDDSRQAFAGDLGGSPLVPLGKSDGPIVWNDTGTTVILSSNESAPWAGRRLDRVVIDGLNVTSTPIAGPSVNGTSGTDANVSPGGRFVAHSTTQETLPGTTLSIHDSVTGVDRHVWDSSTTIASDQDVRRSRPVAAVWLSEQVCVFAGSTGLFRATLNLTSGIAVWDVQSLDVTGGEYIAGPRSATDAVFHDVRDGEAVHVDIATGVVTMMGDGLNLERSSALLTEVRKVLFTNTPPGGPDQIKVFDAETKTESVVTTPEPDATKAPTTYVRNLQVRGISATRAFLTWNIVSAEDAAAGVHAAVLAAQTAYAAPLFAPAIILPQEPETTINHYDITFEHVPTGLFTPFTIVATRLDFDSGMRSGLVGEGTIDPVAPMLGPVEIWALVGEGLEQFEYYR